MMKVKLRELQLPGPVPYQTTTDPDLKALQNYHEQRPDGSDGEREEEDAKKP